MIIEYASLRGSTDGMDLKVITEMAQYFEDEIGYIIPPMTPFVGRDFNSTRAGIHADGMLKDPEIYNIFNTEKILNRAPRIAITNTSGLAGIAYWLNEYYDVAEDHRIQKTDELCIKLKAIVDQEYDNGRTTSMSDEELDNFVRNIDRLRHKKLDAKVGK